MANTADTTAAGKIIEVTFTGTGADWSYSTDGGFSDFMYVKSIIWHPSGADDILVVNEGGVDGPSIVHWKAYADLVTNGGFPSATTGWTAGASATLASVSGGQSGNCLRITGNGEANPHARQAITGIMAEKGYKFSTYVKQGTESTFQYYLYDVTNSAGIKLLAETEATASWVEHVYFFNAPAGCASIQIYLYPVCAADSGKNIYFDTVSFSVLPINKQIDFGEKGVPLKPYIDITDCTFSDITATKIIFILE